MAHGIYRGVIRPDSHAIRHGTNRAGAIVTRDATSGKLLPQSSAEWSTLAAPYSLPVPQHLWLLQEAGLPCADSIGSTPMNHDIATNFRTPVSGWSARGPGYLASGGGGLNMSPGSVMPDMNTTSVMTLTIHSLFNDTGTPNAVHNIGPGGTEINNLEVRFDGATNHYTLTDGTNSGTGTIDHGTGVVYMFTRHNRTATTQDLFVSGEKISKTWQLPAANSYAVPWFGTAYAPGGTASVTFIYAAMWTGAAAEMTDGQLTALYLALQG